MVQPQHLHMVPFIIIINLWLWRMMLMMMMIIIINCKGYFSVNPILSFGSFLGKKSAVVNVVIAPKYL